MEIKLGRYSRRYMDKNPVYRGLQTILSKGSLPVPSKNLDIRGSLVRYDHNNSNAGLINYKKLVPTQPYVSGHKVRSMVRGGVENLKPISVVKRKNGDHLIIDGHHTYTAYRMHGIDEIPSIIYNAIE